MAKPWRRTRDAGPSPVAPPLRRDIEPASFALVLRASLGLPPEDATPAELAVLGRRAAMPTVFRGVDAGALVAWATIGIPLLAGRLPTLNAARNEATRVIAALAIHYQADNLTAAAEALAVSRRRLRDVLRAAGLRDDRSTGGEGEP